MKNYKIKSSLKILLLVGIVLTVMLANITPVSAALVNGPDIIAAPDSVIDDPPGATNTHQQAFDERQGVLLVADLDVDGGTIPAGTYVNSHMIFLNTEVGSASDTQTWTFDGVILGVMSDQWGTLEIASTPLLGAPGTDYPAVAFNARGMEGSDSYSVSGNQITVNMWVSEPGDWIRVITQGVVEVSIDIKPGSFPNSINLDSNGVLPVAILTTDDFDASMVDPTTLELAGAEAISKGKSGKVGSLEDVDGDGDLDLVIQVKVADLELTAGDTEAILTGETYDGIPIEGVDSVRIVPEE
jgi:hypothetical protein